MTIILRIVVASLSLHLVSAALLHADDSARASKSHADVEAALVKFCGDCHGAETRESEIQLTELSSLDRAARLDAMSKAQVQVFFGLMPPADADQPTASERRQLCDWLGRELRAAQFPALEDKLPTPEYGNAVDHENLFCGAIKDKAYTPARRWLVSPQIFQERVFDALRLDDGEKARFRPDGLYGVANPFHLPDRSGVRDYDLTAVDGGHFLVMQMNVAWIVDKILGAIRVKNGEPFDVVFPNPADRWCPQYFRQPQGAAVFEKVMLAQSPPTDVEWTAAIQAQFAAVLQRPATDEELANYLALTRAASDLGGPAEGLRKMLEAVLLESEFIYRLEFGAGPVDKHGRRTLAPREASYAIAFALGDKNPDAALAAAGRDGRLLTKQDYEREVRRLLADDHYFKAGVDPQLHGQHWHSHVSTHPKIVRFFREFFGYPQAVKVFKDHPRSDGYYQNPDRGSPGTPGTLIDEADQFVDWRLKHDQQVFESLLGSDLFFVTHVDNAAEKIEGLKAVYEHFKHTQWRLDPNNPNAPLKLSDADDAFIHQKLKAKLDARGLEMLMKHVEHFQKQGLNPGPIWSYKPYEKPLAHAASYGIDTLSWEYPLEQPFRVKNYKGILTHPAWLIAHSQNSATDPIRRGKWIREKLLAGMVPDVPITVDAVIPENPDLSLRQRLHQATGKQECWKCHRLMNPLGLAFESYDDFGRFRTQESLEHPANLLAKPKFPTWADTYKTVPVDSGGRLDGAGAPALEGEVRDAHDLIDRLIKSERVRQSIIRHAFRFYMGRNEMLSDSRTLIDADQAYVRSGGSFKEVIVSLLTSDSFMYRK